MTYTFKLARRLAVSRDFAMLASLALLAACAGETTTAPDGAESIPAQAAVLSVYPRKVTAETNQPVRFRGNLRNLRGDTLTTVIAWAASGGTMNADGTFASTTAGTFKVIGRGRGWKQTDTSIVVVVPPGRDVASIAVRPGTVSLTPGQSQAFTAAAYLADGSRTTAGVNWTATGGDIDAAGTYTAGAGAGSYRVIATNTAGTLADTAAVTISAPPPPAPTLTKVYVLPASVTLATGGTKQFKAYGRNSLGDSVSVSVTFAATGGTVTSGGLYTAGGTAGSFRVIAKAGTIADTSAIGVTAPAVSTPVPGPGPAPTGTGVPVGVFNVSPSGLTAPFNLSVFAGSPAYLIGNLETARKNGTKVIVNFAGGKYSNNYGPDGTFSYDVWKARVDQYRGLDLGPYIADGTLAADYLIDEPHNAASWGGKSVPYETLERMAQYSKSLWPGLKTIIRTRVSWLAKAPFQWTYLDAGWAQYTVGKGDIYAYRDTEVAAARASGLALLFGINNTNGGAVVSGCYPGSRAGLCAMTAAEVKRFGSILAGETAACGLTLWQFDAAYLGRSDIRAALDDVTAVARARPAKACT